ncbi:MAG: PAS domain S-box protein [Armatimonadota bacterium]
MAIDGDAINRIDQPEHQGGLTSSALPQDLTERKQSELALEVRLRLLQLAPTSSFSDLLIAMLDEGEVLTGSQIGFFHFLEADQVTLSQQVWSTNTTQKMCRANSSAQHYPLDQAGVWVDCIRERKPVIHNDYVSLLHRKGLPEGHTPVIRELVVPIIRHNNIVAVIGVGNKPVDYTELDVTIVSSLADLAWDIVDSKRAEEALRDSEETYRTLVNGVPDLLMRFDSQGRHLFVSKNISSFGGLQPAQIIGKTHRELGHQEKDCQFWEESIRKVFDSKLPLETEYTIETEQGALVRNWRLWPEFDAQGAVKSVFTMTRDITAQRQAERDYQTLFREMINGFAVHEIICNEQGHPIDYRFIAVNPAFEQMSGLRVDDVIGRTALELLPGTEQHWIDTYGKVALTGEPVSFENYHSELGKYFEVTAFQPTPKQFACIFADITERKQATEALRKSEEQSKGVIETLPLAIYITSAKDQSSVYLNPTMVQLFGYTIDEVPSIKHWLLLAYPDPAYRQQITDEWSRRVKQYIETQTPFQPLDAEVTCKDGSKKIVLWAYIALGDVNYYCGLNQTKTKRAEENLRRSEQRYARAIAATSEAIWERDLITNKAFYSPRWYEMLGYEDGEFEMTFKAWKEICHPDDFQTAIDKIQKSLDSPYDVGYEAEFRMKTKTGDWRWILGKGNVVERDASGKPLTLSGTNTDITERKRTDLYRQTATEILRILNEPGDILDSLKRAVTCIKTNIEFSAVGIRLQDGDDFPYYAHEGFQKQFMTVENHIVERGANNGIFCDDNGLPRLECICGWVISGKVDHTLPFCTRGGSFWTNDLAALLGNPSDKIPWHHPHNTCLSHGYSSMAVVPIRSSERNIGTIQLNDLRKGCLTLDAVEAFEGIATHIGAALMRRLGEASLQQAYVRESVINDILRLALLDESLDSLMNKALSLMFTVPMPGLEPKGAVFLVDAAGDGLVLMAQQGLNESVREACAHIPFGKCLCGRVASTGQLQFVDHIDDDHDVRYDGIQPHGHYCIPMRYGDRLVGVLTTYTRPGDAHSQKLEQFLVSAADILATVVTRKQSEATLRASEERFRSYFDLPLHGIATTSLDHIWMDVNDQLCTLLGYDRVELQQMTWSEMTHPDDIAVDLAQYQQMLSGQIERYKLDKRFIRKDGQVVWTTISVGCVRRPDGLVDYVVCVMDDITERRKAEIEKAQLEEQLHHAMKMDSIGRLAGGVAHDFNNMLGVIIGHAQMALDGVDSVEPLYEDLHEIYKAAERSADLTRNLLAFARKQTVIPKVIDLNTTVEGMLKMLQRLIGENIELRWNPQAEMWMVKVDPSQIDQILANLCVNARDAIANVGRITIQTSTITIDPADVNPHMELAAGDYVRLTVSDTGCGMDKETQAKIFEPFYTTKGVGEGTGLGLATVYGAVKQNNGYIHVYSEPGEGTTFNIYLPRHIPITQQAETTRLASPAAPGHETILLVEDEPSILRMVTTMITRSGYNVISASTPGEAIRMADQHAGTIDLLLTDVVMPEMNGRDLAKNLLTRYPGMKRLFMSGYTADVIADQGRVDDGVHFIQKPFTLKDINTKIRQAIHDEA